VNFSVLCQVSSVSVPKATGDILVFSPAAVQNWLKIGGFHNNLSCIKQISSCVQHWSVECVQMAPHRVRNMTSGVQLCTFSFTHVAKIRNIYVYKYSPILFLLFPCAIHIQWKRGAWNWLYIISSFKQFIDGQHTEISQMWRWLSSVLWHRVDLADKYAVSIYVTIDSTFPNETKVMGNRSAQLRVATVAQQSFHVAERERERPPA
jgi:hypothetical protein